MTKLTWVAAVLTVLALGCGGESPDASNSAPLQPSSPSAGEWADSLILVEEVSIGGLVGDEEYTFGYVGTLAPAPDGSLYVSDNQLPIIRKYGADGVHIGDIGRGGEGPGEYRSIDGLAVLKNGELRVWDSGNRRLSTFSNDGAYVGSVRVDRGRGGWRGFVQTVGSDVFLRVAPDGGSVESREGPVYDWAQIASDGTLTRLRSAPPEQREGPRYVLAGRGGYYLPFSTATLNAMGNDGTYYEVRNDVYSISRVLANGTTSRIVRDEAPIQLTADELREWTARSESFAKRTPERRGEYFPIPKTKPFIRELATDLDGRLWVSRYTEAAFMEYTPAQRADREELGLPSYQWRDTLTWDIFSPEGTHLGHVTFPFNTTFVTAKGDEVWGIRAGEFREDYVMKWRIEAAPGS